VPRVAALAPDLFFATKIETALGAAGYEVTIVSTPDQLSGGGDPWDVVIVDLDAVTPVGVPHDAPRLGFYSHVDVETKHRAVEAGFDLVVPRSRMAREMPALVARLLGSG
jgi:hypothetical protein